MTDKFQTEQLDEMAKRVIPEEYFEFSTETAREHFFNDDRMLVVKQRIHNEFRTNPKSIVDHLRDCLALRGDEALLDLGCGNGFILEKLLPSLPDGHVTGIDNAPAVLAAAEQKLSRAASQFTWIETSADDLSMLDDNTFDRVMANYMMHYVPNIDGCFREVRRVMRPGGKFLLSTDSTRSMIEMYDVHFSALREMNAPPRLFKATPKGRISLDNAIEQLQPHFELVERVVYEDQLRFEDAEPFLEFYMVGHNYCCAGSVPDQELSSEFFAELRRRVRALVLEAISEKGSFTVTKLTGTLVCQ